MTQSIPFKVGQRISIYQRPLTQEDFEDVCVLVKLVRGSDQFRYDGLHVEEWKVRFDGETDTYTRVIAVPI